MSVPLLTVFTDASFCHRTKAAGWAAWAKRSDMPTFFYSAPFAMEVADSFEAEAGAIGNACFLLMKRGYIGGDQHVLIKTDCLAVISAVGRFAHKNAGRIEKYMVPVKQAKEAVRCLEIRHVKAHSGKSAGARFAVNERCDEAARAAMEAKRRTL